jgi:TetR/AcrR family transcriptional repressor of nem operon
MRYDADHKEKTRERVLKAAAQAIRAQGPHRVGVATVMSKAGLTHGGFYAHFASKDELIAAAIAQMFADSRGRFDRETQQRSPAEGLSAYIDFYLSPAHRDAVARGCPIPVLAAELRHLSGPAKKAFAAGVQALTSVLAQKLAQLDHKQVDALASSALAEMIGALSLARAESDAELSDAILSASRGALKQRLALSKHK